MSTTKENALSVRLSQGDAALIKKAATKIGVSVSTFIAQAAAEKAAKVSRKCPVCGRAHRAA